MFATAGWGLKRRWVSVMLGLIGLALLVRLVWIRPGAELGQGIGLAAGSMSGFRLVETNLARSSEQYTFTKENVTLRVEVIRDLDLDAAEALVKDGRMNLEALYANAMSPYPGDISRQVVADPRFQPRFERRNSGALDRSYFLLFANDRFGYGVTTPDSVRYRSLLGWFYCPVTRAFYKVRCFGPLAAEPAELEALFFSLRCP